MVVIAGKITDKDATTRLIEEKLGMMKQGGIMDYTSAGGYGPVDAKLCKKKTEQAHFYMGVPALSMHDPRRYALQMAQIVLGGGMSSRLFNEIREKRGLYYVKSDLILDTCGAGVKLSQLSEVKVVKESKLGSDHAELTAMSHATVSKRWCRRTSGQAD
jgi:predicted Zn-dependent peptidase